MTESDIRDFYSSQVRHEWRRLVKDPYHRLEFETTLRYLNKYLPASGQVLDAGGGPGRYTITLAKQGYDMTLLDYTPANLDFARRQIKRNSCRKMVKAVIEGSIVDLSMFADATFDAVLCTGGPLSHVLDQTDRRRAVAELVRVAKPGAPIFVSVMSRLSVEVIVLCISAHELEMPHFKLMRDCGDYFGGSGFTACHFYLPEELCRDFKHQPVEVLEMVGLEGIGANHRKEIIQAARNPTRWAAWLETHYLTCTHPAVVGLSEHFMIICRKN
jgi:SAM-dependent methyltransferase